MTGKDRLGSKREHFAQLVASGTLSQAEAYRRPT